MNKSTQENFFNNYLMKNIFYQGDNKITSRSNNIGVRRLDASYKKLTDGSYQLEPSGYEIKWGEYGSPAELCDFFCNTKRVCIDPPSKTVAIQFKRIKNDFFNPSTSTHIWGSVIVSQPTCSGIIVVESNCAQVNMSQLILNKLQDKFDDLKITHLPTILYVETTDIVETVFKAKGRYYVCPSSLEKTTVSDIVTLHLENGEKVDYFAYGADYYKNKHFVSNYRTPLNNWSIMDYNDLANNGVACMLDQSKFTFSSSTKGSLALVQYVQISTLPQTVQRHIRESFRC